MKKNVKNKKDKKIFLLSSLILCIVNSVCNIIAMFKGNTYSYLFDLTIGQLSVKIIASMFILLATIMMIMKYVTGKKDYLIFSFILYIFIILLQIPVFKLEYTLFISLFIFVLLLISLIKEKK